MLIAYRDPTVYYLQLFLHSFYGFLIGAVFYMLHPNFDRLNDIFSGITWMVFLQCYMHVFKVHYLAQSNARFHHEHANKSYAVFPYWCAEFLATAINTVVFLPGIIIAYFMMGLPGQAFGVVILVQYVLALASEGMVHFVTQFSRDAAYSVVAAQSVLIILSVFTTGSLITEDQVPGWWVWLEELSFFAHSSRAMAHAVEGYLSYDCGSSSSTTIDTVTQTCNMPSLGYTFPCSDSFSVSPSTCFVNGEDVLYETKHLKTYSKWLSFLYLLLLQFFFRFGTLLLYYYPFHRVWLAKLRNFFNPRLQNLVYSQDVLSRRMERQIGMLQLRLDRMDVDFRAALKIQRFWRSNRYRRAFRDAVYAVMDRMKHGQSLEVALNPTSLLVWKNLTLKLKNQKVLIDNVDGFAMGGRVLAIMGPSGAGKTTLLNALSGRTPYADVSGGVWLNGRQMKPRDIYFVPQFDDLSGWYLCSAGMHCSMFVLLFVLPFTCGIAYQFCYIYIPAPVLLSLTFFLFF